jgi:[ribosomal protein S5]-alanine N-acetyltransferase
MSGPLDTIVTARLLGARLSPTHFEELRRLHRDPQVMATLSADGQPLSDEAIQKLLSDGIAHWERHNFGFWIFHDRLDGRFVGRGGLKVYSIDSQDVVGLAYAIVSDRVGRGFATEMGAASLDTAFHRLGMNAVDSWTLPVNRASQRVMEKLGFQYDRDFEFAGLPHRYYRLDARNWSARRAASG